MLHCEIYFYRPKEEYRTIKQITARIYGLFTLYLLVPYSRHITNIWWRHQMETFSALLYLCAGIHRSPVNSPHIGQWRGALMLSLICAWVNAWVNNRETGDLRRHRAHYDVIVMKKINWNYVNSEWNNFFYKKANYQRLLISQTIHVLCWVQCFEWSLAVAIGLRLCFCKCNY